MATNNTKVFSCTCGAEVEMAEANEHIATCSGDPDVEARKEDKARRIGWANCGGRIFVGLFPTCILYADREREKNHDYATLARFFYSDMKFELAPDCPAELANWIKDDVAKYKVGDVIGSNNPVTIGYELLKGHKA